MKMKFELAVFVLATALISCCNATPIDFLDILRNVPNTDITDLVNTKLRTLTEAWPDKMEVLPHADISIDPGSLVNLTLGMDHLTTTYLNKITARDCDVTGTAPVNVDLTFVLDELWIESHNYTMSGILADTIPLTGDGPMMIKAYEMTINLVGVFKTLAMKFDSVKIDFEMTRWVVDFEGVMPGTDLGELFNSFFSMVGPELLDLVENNLNSGTVLLDWINSLIKF